MHIRKIIPLFIISCLLVISAFAQKKAAAKYPSLFWEITGNGLKKPSYLFGTMHVSSKMVFHLSDSFYLAIKNVDAVALELNADDWQSQMVAMDKIKADYAAYVDQAGDDFLTQSSFRINAYDDMLKAALSSEPAMVNSLLYRSYRSKEDFEEDTFLDLYIYQTGRKLGKRSTGVENYYETEKLVMEAYADMAKEKKRKFIDTDGESRYDIEEKMQDAYRRGDLDLLDSLDLMTDPSDAFREKFLYKRNEIQANSIDTILRKSSLFVGVGASHLPGNRGVIELLRKKGYILRPIRMQDKDAAQKDAIDKLKVPVQFSTQQAPDGTYSVSLPGPLYKFTQEYQLIDRRQYADMSNGAYYMVTSIPTHAAFLGQSEKEVMKRIDSALYENVPGKILSRKTISVNGYPAFDIANRTRRGDLQRSVIVATPFEIIIFKMSGKDNYVQGIEATQFFSSIQVKERPAVSGQFLPRQGGFSIQFPQPPHVYLNTLAPDGIPRWEYEAADKANGDAYLVFNKTASNFSFLEVDSFDLSLVEESFRNPERYTRQMQRRQGSFNGYPMLDVREKMKDSSEILARYIIQGPRYYVLAVRTTAANKDFSDFFNSFHLTPFHYDPPGVFTDTFMHFTVTSPVLPALDPGMRSLSEDAMKNRSNTGYNFSDLEEYWPRMQKGVFRSDSTGEMVSVNYKEFPRYYSVEDSTRFWKNQLAEFNEDRDFIQYSSRAFNLPDGVKAFDQVYRDTNSSRTIRRMVYFNKNYRCSLLSVGDTLTPNSAFIDGFYSSFRPGEKIKGNNIYENHMDQFFTDLFSKDSVTSTTARQSISGIYFGEKNAGRINDAINRLRIDDKAYFDIKSKLIAELGYIKDTTHPQVVAMLKKIYDQVGDTSLFRNEVFRALARHKTSAAYKLLKELLLQDPPIFEDSYEYTTLFSIIGDTLKLSRELFPEVLQLLSVDDYKSEVMQLLVTMVDSNIMSANDYADYFTRIWFDAKVQLKKQQTRDERIMEKESMKEKEENASLLDYSSDDVNTDLENYSVLLMPFYEKNANVQKFFEKLLRSKEDPVRMSTAVLMLRNKKEVADSILRTLAADDRYSSRLYEELEKAGLASRFPAAYRNQLQIAKSLLVADRGYGKPDSLVFISKQRVDLEGRSGLVYFFKYRVKKEGDWKIGISGLQPLDESKVATDDKLVSLTDKKLRETLPQDEQLQLQLKKLLMGFHKSARKFYEYDDLYSAARRLASYGE